MNSKIDVVLSPEADKVYDFLMNQSRISKTEKIMFSAINQKIGFIKENTHYGDPIAKKLIPKEYKKQYNVINLFRVELPLFWRMLYTITKEEDEIIIIAFILDILDHKNYNKKFGYKKK